MNVRHPQGVLHTFPIKKFFYDKMNLRLFYLHMTTFPVLVFSAIQPYKKMGDFSPSLEQRFHKINSSKQ